MTLIPFFTSGRILHLNSQVDDSDDDPFCPELYWTRRRQLDCGRFRTFRLACRPCIGALKRTGQQGDKRAQMEVMTNVESTNDFGFFRNV